MGNIVIPCPLDWRDQHWHVRDYHVPGLFIDIRIFKEIKRGTNKRKKTMKLVAMGDDSTNMVF